jgi:hypothetical protein
MLVLVEEAAEAIASADVELDERRCYVKTVSRLDLG